MNARTLALAGIVIGSLGIFVGFYFYFTPDVPLAVRIVTILNVGVLGIAAFIRHFIFQKDDAERLGWVTEHPDWQYEVGFANLAFGLVGLWAGLGNLGLGAQGAILGAFGVYLLQAGLLNGFRSLFGQQKNPARFIRSGVVTLLFSLTMLFFAWSALSAQMG
jgi:hypothetical protein